MVIVGRAGLEILGTKESIVRPIQRDIARGSAVATGKDPEGHKRHFKGKKPHDLGNPETKNVSGLYRLSTGEKKIGGRADTM